MLLRRRWRSGERWSGPLGRLGLLGTSSYVSYSAAAQECTSPLGGVAVLNSGVVLLPEASASSLDTSMSATHAKCAGCFLPMQCLARYASWDGIYLRLMARKKF